MASEIRTKAKRRALRSNPTGLVFHHPDSSFCDFLGNLSELLYNQNKSVEASVVIEEARSLAWARLREYGVVVSQQNINEHGDVKVWEERKKATEEELEAQLANVPAAVAGGKGAPPAKGAKAPAPAKGAPAAVEDADQNTESSSLDFSKSIDYKLAIADTDANSSAPSQNIYIRGLENAIRLDLRHAQYLSLVEAKHEEAKKILGDCAKITTRTLYVNP